MATREELLDELLKDYKNPDDFLGKDGIFAQLKKALMERALGAEMTHHLGYEKNGDKPTGTTNQRHGYSAKTVITEDGPLEIEVPRDRDGEFEHDSGEETSTAIERIRQPGIGAVCAWDNSARDSGIG